MPLPRQAPGECPVCGAAVPRQARACPECGADERSGWNDDDTRYDGLELPDSAYDDAPAPRRRSGPHPAWRWVAFALLVTLIVSVLGLS